MDFLYFSLIDWNATWQRPQQLASRLSALGKLLYINPLGMRTPGWKDIPRLLQRIRFRFQKAGEPEKASPHFHSPLLYLPFPYSHIAQNWNALSLRSAIRKWMHQNSARKPVVWVNYPSLAILKAIEGLEAGKLIYDCIDEYSFFQVKGAPVRDIEASLISKADIVLAASAALHERLSALHPRCYLVPNAVDYEHIAGTRTVPGSSPGSFRHPVLGYIGELADWFDFELIARTAEEHPEWTIILAGPQRSKSADMLRRYSNVFFPGRISYSEVPGYLSVFDVCLIPFRITPLTEAVNPVKLYEYLASGKPVVSTNIREVRPFEGIVEIASRDTFSHAVTRALSTGSVEAAAERRREVAQRNTWDIRVECVMDLLEASLEGRARAL